MSHRIFVNTQNTTYRKITENGKGSAGFQFGLGVPTELTDQEKIDLQQRANEIYFSADDLREKQRKLRVILDSFTDPKMFGDGSIDIKKVQRYSNDIITDVLPIASTLNAIKLNLLQVTVDQTRRQDDAAPWKMTRADFPNITAQAIAGSSSRRSIVRLYDDRRAIGGRNISTEDAIARLIRECVADALFCESNPQGGITLSQHPGPGGDTQSRDDLLKYFPFKFNTSNTDRTERTYVDALVYLNNYIELIDTILNLQDQTLSRSPDVEQALISIPITIKLETANVQLFNALASTARQVVREKILTFFNEDREYKTLLNFGDDRQYVAEAWRLKSGDSGSVQLKLTRPLNTDVDVETTAFISREIAQSVVDTVNFELPPPIDDTPYLRPFNMDARNYVDSKMFSTNTTLTSLGLTTASEGSISGNNRAVSYEDTVFRRWLTADFKSSELNIDFTDYNNFVHFGSAYKRLETFVNKLEKIEQLTSASISSSVSSSTVSIFLKAKEKEGIIRNFDPYEQFLYYATSSIPYSASAFYVSNETEYNPTGSWPKQTDGTIYSPYSSVVETWLSTQLGIAQRYDDNNPNYLILNLPKHIQEDDQSTDFLTFMQMIGHLMDNIKVYIDQFPYIYTTDIDPLKNLSMDQVYEVAQSFGLNLPNVYALESLQTFNAQFSGETGSRAYVAETWKRFLHSMVYLSKTKGSRTSFDALLNTYGINSPILQIKETTYPSINNYIQSDELTYGLRFTGSAQNSIRVPFVSSSITASTLQISFNPILRRSSSIVTANNWAIDLTVHPSASSTTSQYIDGTFITFNNSTSLKYGRIEVLSGSGRVRIASSSYFPLFSDDYTHLMLRSQSADISIIQTDGDQILFQESASVNLSSLWNNTTHVYVGGSGSMKHTNFDGIVDEVRVWGENISTEDFIAQAYDPGSYYGNTYTSSYTSLYVHVPFSQPLASITQSATNESPYQNVSITQKLPAENFLTSSYSRILRSIKQYTPIVGSTIYTNKKVNVVASPTFGSQFIDENGTKTLSRITSIKEIQEKQYDSGQNIIWFAVSPTDFINQNIIRSMGVVDVNNLIGSPRYITGPKYSTLQSIENDYLKYFNKTVRPNDYIRFFKDLTEGPSEMADEMVPARGKLLDGIVIESPILSRNKDKVIRKFAVDGSATKKFISYVSGSGSAGIGAYDFNQTITPISLLPDPLGDTLLLNGSIAISGSVQFRSSTKSNKLPPSQRIIQQIGDDYVTSSIADQNSSYSTIESILDTGVSIGTVSTGYPRNPYTGLLNIPTEENTTLPFYNIPPRSNFSDVGTTSYFHNSTGIYSYDIFTRYKTKYLVRLDTDVASTIDRLYAPITLLPSSSLVDAPERSSLSIRVSTNSIGALKVANIFSLYGVEGNDGIRIRLYRNLTDLTTDTTRSFSTAPSVNSGVLFDAVLGGSSDVFPYTPIQTVGGDIYYNIENVTQDSIIKLYYFIYEPVSLAPTGYLPRHYKFSRDNTTSLKRRNYIGCKITSTTFDQTAPIIITLSGVNTVVVNSTTTTTSTGTGTINVPSQINTIQFGGGGTLNVE